jgi:hypothetical protein
MAIMVCPRVTFEELSTVKTLLKENETLSKATVLLHKYKEPNYSTYWKNSIDDASRKIANC